MKQSRAPQVGAQRNLGPRPVGIRARKRGPCLEELESGVRGPDVQQLGKPGVI